MLKKQIGEAKSGPEASGLDQSVAFWSVTDTFLRVALLKGVIDRFPTSTSAPSKSDSRRPASLRA